jgi:Fic family protein
MRVPAPPPDWDPLFARAVDEMGASSLFGGELDDPDYLAWDKVRFKEPPAGLTPEQWWAKLKVRRIAQQRNLPLRAKDGMPLHYNLTDRILRECEELARRASGQISIPELAMTRADRDRYIVSSLIEEAITSSQLEGASTSRRVAKQMIRSGRPPATRSERMIANNYRAMEQIREWRDDPLTPARILELHRMVTEGTLDDPADAGRLQVPDEDRVTVYGDGDQVLHRPPSAAELPGRLALLCDFANGATSVASYLPDPVRAVIVHYMVGYDHYFVDGNGRTARALFYWCMLRSGYWLTEYVTISKILKNAPARYAGAYLLSEDDDNDVTYFVLYQLGVLRRATDELQKYLSRKAGELRRVRQVLEDHGADLNHRQLALLDRALHDPDADFTVVSHGSSHRVSGETARQDLQDLERRGLLVRSKRGKANVWKPAADLTASLRE